jgi:hypothetical protein
MKEGFLLNWNGKTGFYELSKERRIAYLGAYWQAVASFHGHVLNPVPDERVKWALKNFKKKPSPEVRKKIKLDRWKCKLDTELSGRKKTYFSTDLDDSNWETVNVPHVENYVPNPISMGNLGLYGGTKIYVGEYAVWFRNNITLESKEPSLSFIEFESCDIDTTVWVNEQPLMISHLGLYPFRVDIPKLKTDNSIVVEVRKKATNDPEYFYQGSFQSAYSTRNWPSGSQWCGISGKVNLIVTYPVFIDNLFVYTEEVNEKAKLVMQFEVSNTTRSKFKGSLNFKLWRWYPVEDKSTIQEFDVPLDVQPWQSTTLKKEVVVKNPALWEPKSPNLYIIHVSLSDGKNIKDDLYDTFGIRSFEVKEADFYLNNKRVFLKGSHHLPFNPTSAAVCPDDYWIVKDILLHKFANMNAARMPSDTRAHYELIAEYADQLGLMLVWAGYASIWNVHPELETLAQRDIPIMVRALRNHPSIITYEMGDEILPEGYVAKRRYEYYKMVEKLVSDNDATRLVCPCGYWTNDLFGMIRERVQKGLSLEEARFTALKDLDLFLSPHVYWDLHGPSQLEIINVYGEEPEEILGMKLTPLEMAIKYLGDLHHPLIETEFGANSMPDWDQCKDESWYHLWIDNPLGNSQPQLEKSIYGRNLDMKEWRLSQAHSAILIKTIIEFCRNIKPKVDGMFVALFSDLWTSYWGIMDFYRRAKLPYTVLKSLFQEVQIMGTQGDFALGSDDVLSVTVINDGDEIKRCNLEILIKDMEGKIISQKNLKNLRIPGNSLVNVAEVKPKVSKTDLYSIEYDLNDSKNLLKGKSIDLVYIQSS